jgi:hypothetical protein
MNSDKLVAYVLLTLAIVAICCRAQARDEYRQDIRLRNEDQNAFSTLPAQFVSKHACTNQGNRCDTTNDCCGASDGCVICQRRYYGIVGSHVCGRRLYRSKSDGGSACSDARGGSYGGRYGHPRCGGDGHRCGRK